MKYWVLLLALCGSVVQAMEVEELAEDICPGVTTFLGAELIKYKKADLSYVFDGSSGGIGSSQEISVEFYPALAYWLVTLPSGQTIECDVQGNLLVKTDFGKPPYRGKLQGETGEVALSCLAMLRAKN